MLIIHALNFKLIDNLENVVFGCVKIDKLDIDVFLCSILTVKGEPIANHLENGFIRFVYRAGNAFQH